MSVKISENLTIINRNVGRTSSILYLVVHYTGNNGDTAWGNTNYFKSTYRGASAHIFIDENEAWLSVAYKDTAWHCGATSYRHPQCRNSNSIGIELCSRKDSKGAYYFKEETVRNAVEIIKDLMKKYNIPIDRVIMHNHVTGKICAAPFVNNTKLWDSFKTQLKTTTTPTPAPVTTPTYKVSDANLTAMVSLEIVNSPEYWKAQTHLQYLDDLFKNAAKAGVCDKRINNGITDIDIAFSVLSDAGVVTTPAHWKKLLADKDRNPWLSALLINMANKCRIILEKIVHAEAQGEGLEGQEYVANVIFNRIKHQKHPTGIYNVVFQPKQFTPITDGAYARAVPSTSVKQAVTNVLNGKDNSKGATYFCTIKSAESPTSWHSTSPLLVYLFQHNNHRFYKDK